MEPSIKQIWVWGGSGVGGEEKKMSEINDLQLDVPPFALFVHFKQPTKRLSLHTIVCARSLAL